MFYNARNKTIAFGTVSMDYITFGSGSKNLVMIPGLGDGLRTVKGSAIPFALMYKEFAKAYRVYVFSRKNQINDGYTTRDMANDVVVAMKQLGITEADILGVSQGGMIAQYIAIDAPEIVHKLILAVTLSKQNELVQQTVNSWMEMAQAKDYHRLMIDTAEKTYSDAYLKKHRWMFPLLGNVGKPKDFQRFLIMAKACIHHNAYDELFKVQCPTLIIGGKEDHVVGVKASEEMHERIPQSSLYLYERFGHGAFEEAKDFNQRVLEFLKEK